MDLKRNKSINGTTLLYLTGMIAVVLILLGMIATRGMDQYIRQKKILWELQARSIAHGAIVEAIVKLKDNSDFKKIEESKLGQGTYKTTITKISSEKWEIAVSVFIPHSKKPLYKINRTIIYSPGESEKISVILK